MRQFEFDGDVVIVTGAGGGMGRSHAIELARRGARVVVNDLGGHPFGGGSDASLAEAVVEEIKGFGGMAVANTQSVATPEGGASLTDTALETWGRLDAVVANAAITRDREFSEMTPTDFDSVLNVNLRGMFFTLQPAYKTMRTAGGGRILGVTSTAGLLGNAKQANYAASKGGALGLIRTIAVEGEQYGITANLLSPGALGTRMHLAMVEQVEAESSDPPLQLTNPERFPRLVPEAVSPLVTILVHRSCAFTGQLFHARGGMYAQPTVTINDGWVYDGGGQVTSEDILAHWSQVTDQSTAVDPGLNAFAHGSRSYEELLGRSSTLRSC